MRPIQFKHIAVNRVSILGGSRIAVSTNIFRILFQPPINHVGTSSRPAHIGVKTSSFLRILLVAVIPTIQTIPFQSHKSMSKTIVCRIIPRINRGYIFQSIYPNGLVGPVFCNLFSVKIEVQCQLLPRLQCNKFLSAIQF